MYLCGEQDVHTLGLTDAYWGMYYITNTRSVKNLFTMPFISDVGLTIGVPRNKELSKVRKLEIPVSVTILASLF